MSSKLQSQLYNGRLLNELEVTGRLKYCGTTDKAYFCRGEPVRSSRLLVCFLIILIAVFASLAGRCFYIQYAGSSRYKQLCTRQQRKFVIQRPQRGEILDCRGRVLAASNNFRVIKAEPRAIKKPEKMAVKLAPLLGLEAMKIYKLITESKNPGYVRLKLDAGERQCKAARDYFGLGVESDWRRYYPMGRLTSNVVGFTSLDNRGLAGIELQYDRQLRGSSRKEVFLADVARRPIRLKQSQGMFEDGETVVLTIDATIQQFARTELLKRYEMYKAESAVAVVAEPDTGAVLAMVSLPDFDPENFASEKPSNFRNRAITDEFEPGSIMKPIVAAIALDEGVVDRVEKVYCEDGLYSGHGFGSITEYHYHKYGHMTLREIIVKSSNIGMAKLGQRLGKERLYKGLRLFGFGRPTGLKFPGETSGLLRPPEKWTGYSLTRIPFGQEITTTAIQLVQAYCILANGGKRIRPYLVRAMVDNNGKVIELKHPGNAGVGYVIDPEVAKWIVSEAMADVVNQGTGRRAQLENWQTFGKTGTANIAKSDGSGYSEDDYVASFIVGAPAKDPAVVVLVSIRKPDKSLGRGYTGGRVASPVAAGILEKTLEYLRVPPDKPD